MPNLPVAPESGSELVCSLSGSQPCTDAEIVQLRRSLREALAERDAYAQDLFEANRCVAELSAQRQALIDRERVAMDREKAAIDREKAVQDRIAAIHASTSWLVTKPIRFSKRLLMRVLSGGRSGVTS